MDREKDHRDGTQEETAFYDDMPEYDAEPAAQDMPKGAPGDAIASVRHLVNEMIDYVTRAKKGLFTQDVLVDRDIMIDNLQRVWELLPPAVIEGENVLRERDRILQEAQEVSDNARRGAENIANQLRTDAENEANRKKQEANEYYGQHKADGDAYLSQCQQKGDAYVKGKKAEADDYAQRTVQSAQMQAESMVAQANKQAQDLMRKEVVYCRAEIAAQELKTKSEADYAARMTEASNNANALYGTAYAQTQKLLKELNEFQKKQNQELLAYCDELEKRHARQ